MTVFWICVGWLAVSVALGVLLGRAIAYTSDERPARRNPDERHEALRPDYRASSHLRVAAARYKPPHSPHLHALASLAVLGGCAVPTGGEPRVTSISGNNATVEYSGERAAEADRKAREACARSGKQAGRASTTAGAAGGSVRSYTCTP